MKNQKACEGTWSRIVYQTVTCFDRPQRTQKTGYEISWPRFESTISRVPSRRDGHSLEVLDQQTFQTISPHWRILQALP